MLARLRAEVLGRRLDLAPERGGRVPRPPRIVENAAGKRDEVSVSGADDGFGLLELGDQSDRDYRHVDALLHRTGEGNLVAGADGDLLARIEAAAGNVDRRAAARFQRSRKLDRLLYVPAALDPVCSDTRIVTGRSAGKAARTASNTSSGKRIRFSKLPPYSSVRRFDSGDRNWWSK